MPNDYTENYPRNVCLECGEAAAKTCGTKLNTRFGVWIATCEVCSTPEKECAAPRDFGYPEFPAYNRKTRQVNRTATPCHCRFQNEKAWGYNLMKWVGGRKAWKHVGNATHLEDVLKAAAKIPTVLIRCNGCGNDVLREYPKKG